MTLFRRTFTRRGAPPGTIVAPDVFVTPKLHVLSYTVDQVEEHDVEGPADIPAIVGGGRTVWVDVHGLGDGSVVTAIGELLGLNPLAVADVIHVGQRPKVDLYDDVLFMVVPMATVGAGGDLTWEQVSLFLGPNYVLTFQETPGDCLDPLRQRIRQGRRQIRGGGADYLACMVVDAIVDGYFPVLERHGEQLEALEDAILAEPRPDLLATLYQVRRELMVFRRSVWPLRDALLQLMRDDEYPVSDSARVYLRDTTDHAMQAVDVNETYRELAASLVEVYLSMTTQRTNEIMRVLTVVASVFIPLTFLAGIYGMNFDTEYPLNMPELRWAYGYVYFLLLCVTVAGLLLVLFRRMGWLAPVRGIALKGATPG